MSRIRTFWARSILFTVWCFPKLILLFAARGISDQPSLKNLAANHKTTAPLKWKIFTCNEVKLDADLDDLGGDGIVGQLLHGQVLTNRAQPVEDEVVNENVVGCVGVKAGMRNVWQNCGFFLWNTDEMSGLRPKGNSFPVKFFHTRSRDFLTVVTVAILLFYPAAFRLNRYGQLA